MPSSIFTQGACPLPPARTGKGKTGLLVCLKNFLLFFFRFGLCPLCITASVGYGLYRLFARLFARLFSSPQNAPSHAES